MLLVVIIACIAAALMIALISLSPRRERLRVPQRTLVGLDRRRHQVQRRMRVSEALAHHELRLNQQREELRLSLATKQPALPKEQWSRSDPAVGVRRGISLPMQPIAPYWQNWAAAPTAAAGYMAAPPQPPYMESQAQAS